MNLILFFTYGVSLKKWAEIGIIDREILLYKELIRKGVNVTFITYGDNSDFQYKDKIDPIELVPFYAYFNNTKIRILSVIYSLLLPFILHKKIAHADVFKTNQMFGSWVALLSKILYRKKMIVRCGYEYYRFSIIKRRNLLYRLFIYITSFISYKYSDLIILTSYKDKNYVVNKFKIEKTKVNVIMNYIDIDIFRHLSHYKKYNKILFVGRLTKQKNIFSLLDAVSKTNYMLDIVGDGELRQEIERYIVEKGLKAQLLGCFPNKEMPNFYNQYSVYILPSYYEGNPKTLLEAMACENVVIGSNVEGIREIIDHRVNGLLCDPTVDSIQCSLEELMNDAQLRARLGKSARKFIETHCSLSSIANREHHLYKRILFKN